MPAIKAYAAPRPTSQPLHFRECVGWSWVYYPGKANRRLVVIGITTGEINIILNEPIAYPPALIWTALPLEPEPGAEETD